MPFLLSVNYKNRQLALVKFGQLHKAHYHHLVIRSFGVTIRQTKTRLQMGQDKSRQNLTRLRIFGSILAQSP